MSYYGFGTEAYAVDKDILVIDAPGWSDEHTKLLALQCDFIVIPCGPSNDDIRPTIRLAYELEDAKIDPDRILIALCRVGAVGEANEARKLMTAENLNVAENVIRELATIRKAQAGGLAANELSHKKTADENAALMIEIIERAEKVGKAEHTAIPQTYTFQPGDEVF